MEDVCACWRLSDVCIFHRRDPPRARTTSPLPSDFGRAFSSEIILIYDPSKYPATSWRTGKVHGQAVSRLRFRSRKELYPMKVPSVPRSSPSPFLLRGADGRTLISLFRSLGDSQDRQTLISRSLFTKTVGLEKEGSESESRSECAVILDVCRYFPRALHVTSLRPLYVIFAMRVIPTTTPLFRTPLKTINRYFARNKINGHYV